MRGGALRHLDDRYSERPNIRFLIVGRFPQHFGAHIKGAPDEIFCLDILGRFVLLRDPEIGEFDAAVRSQEDVPGLNVVVDNVHLVEVQKALKRLRDYVRHLAFVQRLERHFHDVFDRSAAAELC